jgi:GNAT superfamily N-acetyltransferase
MLQITPEQLAALQSWFSPERQHLITLHILNTGNGQCFVDRWPEPRVLLSSIGRLCSLSGDPNAITPANLRERLGGIVHASSRFLPLIKTVFPDVRSIDRVILELQEKPAILPEVDLRRVEASGAGILEHLDPDLHWIANTWGGLPGLAASGCAWAAFIDGKAVSLAATFLSADRIEDIGVVTNSAYRGLGLAPQCAAALCQDIQSRGRRPSWTTSHDNRASIRAAEKLGFKFVGPDVLYVL